MSQEFKQTKRCPESETSTDMEEDESGGQGLVSADKQIPAKDLGTEIKCVCLRNSGKPCWHLFTEDMLKKDRHHHMQMKKESLDLVILAKIAASIKRENDTKHKPGSQRQRSHILYQHEGRQICRETFMFIHGIRKNRLNALVSHYKKEGLTQRVHKNTTQTPKHAFSSDDKKQVVKFIKAYANQHCVSTCNRDIGSKADGGLLTLPFDQQKMLVHKKYNSWCVVNDGRAISLKSFISLWNKHLPYIVVSKRKPKQQTSNTGTMEQESMKQNECISESVDNFDADDCYISTFRDDSMASNDISLPQWAKDTESSDSVLTTTCVKKPSFVSKGTNLDLPEISLADIEDLIQHRSKAKNNQTQDQHHSMTYKSNPPIKRSSHSEQLLLSATSDDAVDILDHTDIDSEHLVTQPTERVSPSQSHDTIYQKEDFHLPMETLSNAMNNSVTSTQLDATNMLDSSSILNCATTTMMSVSKGVDHFPNPILSSSLSGIEFLNEDISSLQSSTLVAVVNSGTESLPTSQPATFSSPFINWSTTSSDTNALPSCFLDHDSNFIPSQSRGQDLTETDNGNVVNASLQQQEHAIGTSTTSASEQHSPHPQILNSAEDEINALLTPEHFPFSAGQLQDSNLGHELAGIDTQECHEDNHFESLSLTGTEAQQNHLSTFISQTLESLQSSEFSNDSDQTLVHFYRLANFD